MVVQPIGEAVFECAGQTYRIGADALKQHDLVQNSSGIWKEDAKDCSTSFTATHALGDFTWLVSFTQGVSGTSVESFELVKQPAEVEQVSGMTFELVEDEG